MNYTYKIENDNFYKMLISDHKLSDNEKELIKKAACQEEVAGQFLGQSNTFYKYNLITIAGVYTAFPNKLIWDDLRDYINNSTVITAPTNDFAREVDNMIKNTTISLQ